MADSVFAAALRRRLEGCTGSAESEWWAAQHDSGAAADEWRKIVQRIGLRMTWALWEIAIEEAGALAQRR